MTSNPARAEIMETTLYFLIPYLGVSLGYLMRNWYPAQCFGGDTLVYFSGMVFAVIVTEFNLPLGNSWKSFKDSSFVYDSSSIQLFALMSPIVPVCRMSTTSDA